MRNALILSVLFAALGQNGAQAAVHSVVISPANKFTPEHIVIRAGDTVEFTNNSGFKHTVTADPSLAANPSHVVLPAGAEPFSAPLFPTKTFSHVFTVTGLYQYICLPHEMHGMGGQVEVVAADATLDTDMDLDADLE